MNDLLHRLTGRSTNFVEPLLNHGLGGPARDQAELRQWLGLGHRRTDTFVRALLVAAEAHPEDCPIDLWFSCADLPLETWSVVGAQLAPTSQLAADILYRPAVFPFPVQLQLSYFGAGRMMLASEESSELVNVSAAGTDLSVNWPEWTGIQGILKPHQSWAAGFSTTIYMPPVSFPYAALQQAVLQRADATAFLQARGVLDGVFSAINPVRAAALLTRALIE